MKHIHNIHKNKQNIFEEQDNISVGFTENAKEIVHTSDKSYAKKTTFPSGRSHYYIKTHNGKFFNPYGLYDKGEEFKSIGGLKQWRYIKVNENTFNMYLSFLKTKNTVWLSNAERENL